MLVAIPGIDGSYSAEAARRLFECELLECPSFYSAIEMLRAGRAYKAVLPVKNSLTGAIQPAAELVSADDLLVTDMIEIQVEHVLAAREKVSINHLETVVSHPQALRQCERFITRHRLNALPAPDTASAIRDVVRGNDSTIAAIGSRRAALIFGATIVAENISDFADNRTLFFSVTLRKPSYREII